MIDESDYDLDQELKRYFKNRLIQLMKRNNIGQEELAIQTNTSRRMISRYINGYCMPSFITIIKIAKALGCSVEDFYFKDF